MRYPSPVGLTLKTVDLLQKIFLRRDGKTVSLGRAHEYLGSAGIYYFN